MTQQQNDLWNADLYDHNHAFVSTLGSGLLEILSPSKGERILDIGCGTGDLAHQIDQSGAEVTGIDQSNNMIQQASKKYPGIPFKQQDILNLNSQNEFDTVFSNATLHWIKAPERALQHIYTSLRSGGRFVAEFGGKDNVKTITDELIQQIQNAGIEYTDDQFPWYFPSVGEYTTLMEKIGFTVRFAQHFDRPTPLKGDQGLRHWMEMFCEGIFENQPDTVKERIMSNVEKNLEDVLYHNGAWVADYKRLRVIGAKV